MLVKRATTIETATKSFVRLPSLSELCQRIICSKLEKYPPEAFAILSPDEWDRIVEYRYTTTAPKHKATAATAAVATATSSSFSTTTQKQPKIGLDSSGRMIPAINADSLKLIEECNPHLATSTVSDNLIWKDCVEYCFSTKSEYNRPKSLYLPWPLLIDNIQQSIQEIQLWWNYCCCHKDENINIAITCATAETNEEKEATIHKSVQVLQESPMSVTLLESTGVGKVVSKLIKSMTKKKQQMSANKGTKGNPSSNMMQYALFGDSSVLNQLTSLVNSWKDVASANGIQIIHKDSPTASKHMLSSSLSTVEDKSRRPTITSNEEQNRKDMEALIHCTSWRKLFAYLQSRRANMKSEIGAQLRKSREHINTDRLKTKACRLKPKSLVQRLDGTTIVPNSRGHGNTSIVSNLKRQVAIASGLLNASHPTKGANTNKIGCSIANALGKKRKLCTISSSVAPVARTVSSTTIANGKKMKIPTSSALNAAKKGLIGTTSTTKRKLLLKR
jgi:hypothetical protein